MKVFLFLLFTVGIATARIGESLDQARVRYGKETETDAEAGIMGFEKGGFVIGASFHKGRISALFFQHPKKNSDIFPPEISEVEIAELLKANGMGLEWEEVDDYDFVNAIYKLSDGSRFASHDTVNNSLSILTKDEIGRQAAAKKTAEKAQIEGF